MLDKRKESGRKKTNEKKSDLLMVELMMAGVLVCVCVSPPFIKLGPERRHFAGQTQFLRLFSVHYSACNVHYIHIFSINVD